MSREEIVRLVSRALAVMYALGALLDVTYVPEYLFSAFRYVPGGYIGEVRRVEATAFLVRLVGRAVIAWLFWRCGP